MFQPVLEVARRGDTYFVLMLLFPQLNQVKTPLPTLGKIKR